MALATTTTTEKFPGFPPQRRYKKLKSGLTLMVAGSTSAFLTTKLASFYKPINIPLYSSVPFAAIYFASYDKSKHFFLYAGDYDDEEVAFTPHTVAAIIGVIGSSLATSPFQNIIAQMKEKNTMGLNAAKHIYVYGSIGGFYKHFVPKLFRDVPTAAVFFPIYEFLRRKYYSHSGKDMVQDFNPLCGFLFGGITGGLTGVLMSPLFTICENVMKQGGRALGDVEEVLELRDQFRGAAKKGIKKLYTEQPIRTIAPKSFIVGATFMGIYEILRRYL